MPVKSVVEVFSKHFICFKSGHLYLLTTALTKLRPYDCLIFVEVLKKYNSSYPKKIYKQQFYSIFKQGKTIRYL